MNDLRFLLPILFIVHWTIENIKATTTANGDWTSWSGCSVTCEDGVQTRTSSCQQSRSEPVAALCIGSRTESQTCHTGVSCPVTVYVGSEYTLLYGGSVANGNTYKWQKQSERYDFIDIPYNSRYSGITSPGMTITDIQLSDAGTYACVVNPTTVPTMSIPIMLQVETKPDVNGNWGYWSSWSVCSVTCAIGTQFRVRLCNNPEPSNGGSFCIGTHTESQICNSGVVCPVNGIWGDWTSWSDCSVTCNTGQQTKTRLCNNPPPTNGGSDCSGFGTESQSCNPGVACPVNGIWGDWTSRSDCSATCNTGQQTKTRLCNNPPPTNGGSDCSGFGTESQSCNPGVACPVDGDWSNWSEWTMCSTSCGGGYWTRYRNCSNPTPLHGGRVCSGNDLEVDPCSAQSCPVSPPTTDGKSQIATIGGIVAAAVVLLLIIGVMFLLYKRRIKKNCSSTKRVLKQKEKVASSRHVYSNDMVNTRNSFPKLEQASTNGIHSTEDGYINLQISSVGSSKDYVYCEINPSTTY